MDLLERFVSLEQSYEEMNTKLKNKVLEGSVLSEKLSAIEFDLMLAEEQLNKTSAKPTPFQNSTATSSDDEESCPGSPCVITSLNNDSDTSQDPLNHHYEKRYTFVNGVRNLVIFWQKSTIRPTTTLVFLTRCIHIFGY